MKDSEAKSKEWWKVAKEYFTKKLKKNPAQHKANERILRYKLKGYQKNFPNFICGSPNKYIVLGQDEKTEVRLSGIDKKEKV